jgi:hypothetical protein
MEWWLSSQAETAQALVLDVVSHGCTPLTAIRGHVEAIVNHPQPDQVHFAQIVAAG